MRHTLGFLKKNHLKIFAILLALFVAAMAGWGVSMSTTMPAIGKAILLGSLSIGPLAAMVYTAYHVLPTLWRDYREAYPSVGSGETESLLPLHRPSNINVPVNIATVSDNPMIETPSPTNERTSFDVDTAETLSFNSDSEKTRPNDAVSIKALTRRNSFSDSSQVPKDMSTHPDSPKTERLGSPKRKISI